jgi:hypothetical protein
MWSVMNSGPVAQLSPRYKRLACSTDVASASTDWPASMVPIGSMVPEMAMGTRRPTLAKARSQPSSAA